MVYAAVERLDPQWIARHKEILAIKDCKSKHAIEHLHAARTKLQVKLEQDLRIRVGLQRYIRKLFIG